MSVQRRVRNQWQGPTAALLVALLAAAAVLLFARAHADLQAEQEVRAATANAAAPVGDAMRKAMSDSASGTVAGSKSIALAGSPEEGVSSSVATRARDSGVPVLEDSDSGVVVVATYDTATPPASVTARREHVTGLRISALDLRPTLNALRPAGGGISLAGPRRTIESLPGPQPTDRPSYDVTLQPGPVQVWTLTLWSAPPPPPVWAWWAALGLLVAGLVAGGWLVHRADLSNRRQQELERLQETSVVTAAMATVAQQSLDLADLLPALTNELVTALGLRGLSLGAPTPDGEREFFAWGVPPAHVPASPVLPAKVPAGESLCLFLARGGRTVARLRVVAGRDLDEHDLRALVATTEVLTSALANADAFAQQRDLLERMKSVDELKTVFLATASHELRTPVTAITGYAQLLASSWDTLSPEEARTYAEHVESSAQRLGALVEDLLDFARLERRAGVIAAESRLDLGEVVTRILDEQPDLAPDHQVLRQAAGGLAVTGSVQALERVVSNLVSNAAKYSPAGTVIRVSVTEKRGRAEIAVDDEGPGVPPAEREQVFTRFFRGSGDSVIATRGAGLGLAIVSEFAATMGGQVSVTSADTGGARFVVSYPLARLPQAGLEGAVDVHT